MSSTLSYIDEFIRAIDDPEGFWGEATGKVDNLVVTI